MTHLWHGHLLLWRVIHPDPGLILLWLTCSWDSPTISAVEHISVHPPRYLSRDSFQTWHFWTNEVLGHAMNVCPPRASPSLACWASEGAAAPVPAAVQVSVKGLSPLSQWRLNVSRMTDVVSVFCSSFQCYYWISSCPQAPHTSAGAAIFKYLWKHLPFLPKLTIGKAK